MKLRSSTTLDEEDSTGSLRKTNFLQARTFNCFSLSTSTVIAYAPCKLALLLERSTPRTRRMASGEAEFFILRLVLCDDERLYMHHHLILLALILMLDYEHMLILCVFR